MSAGGARLLRMAMTEPTLVDLTPATVAVVRDTVPMASIRAFYDRTFPRVAGALAAQGVAPGGPAVGVYWGEPTDTVDMACGFPTSTPIEPDGDVVPLELPAGRAAQATHEGSYETLGDSYGALAAWMAAQGVTPAPTMWESYETEPTPDTDPATLRTRITWLVAD